MLYIDNYGHLKGKTYDDGNFIQSGELVFTTSMTGYQEVLTDPSYAGQIIVMSYPMIGNYGINDNFNQSTKIHAKGLIVNEIDEKSDFYHFVKNNNIPLIKNIDTRMLISLIKKLNYPHLVISSQHLTKKTIQSHLNEVNTNCVKQISTINYIDIQGSIKNGKKIAIIDFGVKLGIVNCLKYYFETIQLCPYNTNIDYLLKNNFNCVLFSNGAGDPSVLTDVIDNIKNMFNRIPIFGICLGHQLLSIALGCKTKQMECAHRGSNHPVINIETNKIMITSQNHGYMVTEDSINKDIEVTYRSVCDNTIEGIKSIKYNAQSVQFHPEGNAGTDDAKIIFNNWFKNI